MASAWQDHPVDEVTPGWLLLHIGPEGDGVEVNGVRLWESPWMATGGRITVAHPQYPNQRHVMTTYQTDSTETEVNFAAGEFSNGAWAFFVQRPT
jgi:hypothetical protein